jgi:hypothetical protein
MHADLSIFCGVQREIWDVQGCFLQVAQMETKQTQNGYSAILILKLTHLSAPCSLGRRNFYHKRLYYSSLTILYLLFLVARLKSKELLCFAVRN